MFPRFDDEGLAQSSFLLTCPRTRQAAVIDPRRDVDGHTGDTLFVGAVGRPDLSDEELTRRLARGRLKRVNQEGPDVVDQ